MPKTYVSYTFKYHLKVLGLLILFAGVPLSIVAGIYQNVTLNSNAQVTGMMPSDVQPLSPPAGCYYANDYKHCPLTAIACRAGQNCTCPKMLVCPSITPPNPSCTPLPCPPGAMCPQRLNCTQITITPTVTSAITITPPAGCYVMPCTIACPVTNPNCCPQRIFCPNGMPSVTLTPQPTCFPRPPCLDLKPACELPQPINGWCPKVTGTVSLPQNQNGFLFYLNSFLRMLFGR